MRHRPASGKHQPRRQRDAGAGGTEVARRVAGDSGPGAGEDGAARRTQVEVLKHGERAGRSPLARHGAQDGVALEVQDLQRRQACQLAGQRGAPYAQAPNGAASRGGGVAFPVGERQAAGGGAVSAAAAASKSGPGRGFQAQRNSQLHDLAAAGARHALPGRLAIGTARAGAGDPVGASDVDHFFGPV